MIWFKPKWLNGELAFVLCLFVLKAGLYKWEALIRMFVRTQTLATNTIFIGENLSPVQLLLVICH